MYSPIGERWLSGLKRTTRNRLIGIYSWVRIPPSPLTNGFRSPENEITAIMKNVILQDLTRSQEAR